MSVIDTTENCRHCLMCRHMCPVGHVSHLETLTPHGWGQVVASEKRGLLEWNDSTVDVMYSCADCGVCQSHCVTDQPLPDAIAAVRANLVRDGLAPSIVETLKERLIKWGNPYEEKTPVPPEGKGEYALFVGDAAVHLWDKTVPALLKVLKQIGIEPALIGRGCNSGYLASSLGLHDLAKRFSQQILTELNETGATKLLVMSPGDYYTIHAMYPERLGISLPEDVQLIDVVSLLDEKHTSGELSFNRIEMGLPYAYVDPTHAVRTLDRLEAPRRLLNAVLPTPVIELFWRKERAHPAGDGALQFVQPELSLLLAKARNEDATQAGAQGMITEDSATLYQLNQLSPSGLPVKGLYELLADRIA